MTIAPRTVPGWDDGTHQPHAPRDPNHFAMFVIVAVFGLMCLALAVGGLRNAR